MTSTEDGEREYDEFDEAIRALTADLDAPIPASALEATEAERWANRALVRLLTPEAELSDEDRDERHFRVGRGESRTTARGRIGSSRRRWLLAAASVVVVAGFAGLAFLLHQRSDREPSPGRVPGSAMLFLVAGDGRTDQHAWHAGDVPEVGAVLHVADRGRIGLQLCGEARVFADAGARLQLLEAAVGHCTLRLTRGRAAVDARGLTPGAALVVAAAGGGGRVSRNRVVGEVTRQGTEVRVLEGHVEVVGGDGSVRIGQAAKVQTMGRAGERSLTAAESTRDWRLVEWFPRVPSGALAALDISSGTADAEVVVDRLAVGPAPITALVIPGAHVIEVHSQNGFSLREEVALEANGQLARRYELGGEAGGEAELRLPVPPPPQKAGGGSDGPPVGGPATSVIPRPPRLGRPSRPNLANPDQTSVDASTNSPEPSPAELLESARRFRAAGDWPATAAAYEELIGGYPESAEAEVALVPLGQVRLEHLGDAAGALSAFETYLGRAPSGSLGEEAFWGRIQALKVLGRFAEEESALLDFIAAFPHSVRTGQARQQLAGQPGRTRQ
jgi:hypothetical protein